MFSLKVCCFWSSLKLTSLVYIFGQKENYMKKAKKLKFKIFLCIFRVNAFKILTSVSYP